MENLDHESFTLNDHKAFTFILIMFNKCKPPNLQFPLQSLFRKWSNVKGQIKFLEFSIVNTDFELFSFEPSPRKQEILDNIQVSLIMVLFSFNGFQGIKPGVYPTLSTWCSIDLLEILIILSETEFYSRIRSLLDFPLKNCAEYLILTLVQTRVSQGLFLLEEMYASLLPMFLVNHVNSIVVLDHIWKHNSELMITSICNLYKLDFSLFSFKFLRIDSGLMNLSRVLDITQEIKESLLKIASCDNHEFTVALGILAGKRDFLHFDQWLSERIKTVGDDFIIPLLNYIYDTVILPAKPLLETKNQQGTGNPNANSQFSQKLDSIVERSQLNLEKLTIVFENLLQIKNNEPNNVSENVEKEISKYYGLIIEIFPNLISPPANSDAIEDAANKYFQKVFTSKISIPEIITLMQNYKSSSVKLFLKFNSKL
jgi:CCR4-NOT transcription complex subunit 1